MIIYPAIDVYNSKAVRLYKGDYNEMTVYNNNLLAVAADFKKSGATHIHIVDLEGAKKGTRANFSSIAEIKKSSGLFCEGGGGIRDIDTIKAYNINKKFHPKENNWVGYVVEVKGKKYYVAGDTDWIPEMSSVICDVAFLPIGATYTMDVYEAEEATSWISSKIFVPTHYGDIVGEKDLGKKFCSRVKNSIELIKFN